MAKARHPVEYADVRIKERGAEDRAALMKLMGFQKRQYVKVPMTFFRN